MRFLRLFDPTYIAFFWPLALLGPVMQAGKLVQNFVLLGYTDGVAALAWYALALGLLGPFQSILGMAPQMITVIGTNRTNRRRGLIMIMSLSGGLSLLLFLVGSTALGATLIQQLYSIQGEGVGVIQTYLRLLSPLLIMLGFRQWTNGLFIRQKRTGWFTLLRGVDIGLVIGFLIIGKLAGWAPEHVVAYSTLAGEAGTLLLSLVFLKRLKRCDNTDSTVHSYRHIFGYYWSLAFTTFMFTLSRPIIFAFVSHYPPTGANFETIVAALSLAFSGNMIFQLTVNQFRHLMTRFGKEDPEGVKRFMIGFTTLLTILLVVVQSTPLARWFLVVCQGAEGLALEWALAAFWVLIPVPAVIAWRNFYHGLAMVHHHTTTMVFSGLARNGSIIVVGFIYAQFTGINHLLGSSLLMIAFTAEAATIFGLIRKRVTLPPPDKTETTRPLTST